MDKSVLVNSLYKKTEANLSNKNNVKFLVKGIQSYFDRNSDIVTDSGIARKILFLDKDKLVIYSAANLDPKEIKLTIKQSKHIKEKWKIMNEPLNTAAMMILRYFTIKKDTQHVELFLTYYSFYFYASLYHKYLPYGANENIMEYTINNLSNKFLIKQNGSLFLTIKHTAIACHERYYKELIRGTDEDIANYVSALKVRLNSFMKKLKNEYTINHAEKNYVNFDSDDLSEDNFHLADNSSYAIKRISDSTVMKLTSYGADMKIIKLASNMNQVSENEIRNVILHLNEDETDNIRKLIELILQLFIFESGNKVEDVKSNIFLARSMELYKKSNTNDKIILEIKSILDKWLTKYSDKYKKTNREATLSNFRRAIYTYFVVHIQLNS